MTEKDEIFALKMCLLGLIHQTNKKDEMSQCLSQIIPTLSSDSEGTEEALNELIKALRTGYNNGPSAAALFPVE